MMLDGERVDPGRMRLRDRVLAMFALPAMTAMALAQWRWRIGAMQRALAETV